MYKKFFIMILFPFISLLSNEIKLENFITTDDNVKLFVKKSGKGPITIFIHGGPGAWSGSFEKLGGDKLEEKLTMIYYDQRGSGRSESSKIENYTIDRMVKDIDTIREFYKAEKIYLLSHSFGGILALNYALKYPENLLGIIFLNSTLNIKDSIKNQLKYINSLLKTNYKISKKQAIVETFLKAKDSLIKKGLGYKMISDNKKNVFKLYKIDKNKPNNYDFAFYAFKMGEYWKDFTLLTDKVDIPVLVINGKKDHSVGERHHLMFKFKNQIVKTIDGGHILYYENGEKFVDFVFDFINKNKKIIGVKD